MLFRLLLHRLHRSALTELIGTSGCHFVTRLHVANHFHRVLDRGPAFHVYPFGGAIANANDEGTLGPVATAIVRVFASSARATRATVPASISSPNAAAVKGTGCPVVTLATYDSGIAATRRRRETCCTRTIGT